MIATQDTPTPQHRQLKNRYDGMAKVTGKAKYAAEFNGPFPRKDLLYAYMVQATIPNGTIASIDSAAAERASGVMAVLTPFNAPRLPVLSAALTGGRRNISILQDNKVHYNGQPIALVVASSLREAIYAARLLKIDYRPEPAKVDFMAHLDEARWPKSPGADVPGNHRGNAAAGFAQSAFILDQTYSTPGQNHNAMETHNTIAWWEGEKLNLYDSTQSVSGVKQILATIFNIPLNQVHVQCPYTGGGFGSKSSVWSHVPLCAMAARQLQRPVKLVVGREQMFGPTGGRPATINRIKLGASPDGRLLAMQHDVLTRASAMEDYAERTNTPTRMLYRCQNNSVSEKLVELNLGVPANTRAPGEATGTAVLEVAMDELAEMLNLDPIQFRLINYAELDQTTDRPWSSKHLRECYQHAAERFGWSKRIAKPGQTVEGNDLIGVGMATAEYHAIRSAAQAIIRILPNGRAFVGSGTQELGTGTYTTLAQTAANALGLDLTSVEAKLGDTNLPKAPGSGASQSTASVLPAVVAAAQEAILKLAQLAVADPQSPLHGLEPADLQPDYASMAGRLVSKSNPALSDSYAALIERNGNQPIEAIGSADPSESHNAFTPYSWGAVFAEVAVDRDTHMVKVRRVVGTYDIGTLINETTGYNQLRGAIVWGIALALYEQAHIDPVYGRTVNANFAEYKIPVNADIGTIDVTALNIPDTKFNSVGARGLGEIGVTGVAAAVSNAIYNATGKRVRHYPITPDKLMATPDKLMAGGTA